MYLTLCWYVDDNKISHEDPKIVDWVITKIEDKFGKMVVKRGKKHTFVGMDIEIINDGRVKIMMKDYITECITSFGEDVSVGAKTPASHTLFEVDDTSPKLKKEKADTFHHIVAKLLFVSKRARIDIQLAIAFLCTRVSCSTDEDWAKLRRLMKYLHSTVDMPRIIGANGFDLLQTWVDASYAIHRDTRSHTGGGMSLGVGVINSKSAKQKLNTKSSTESEVVATSDYLPYTIWTKKFLEAQGYEISKNVFYQDNQSAIKIEKNGRASCGEKSRHIDIRYFFIKDVLKRENIDIEYCPTGIMIADFFTKPLQGNLFKKLRDIIMGIASYPIEERVEKNSTTIVNGNNERIPKMTYAKALMKSEKCEANHTPVFQMEKIENSNKKTRHVKR